MLRGQLGLTPIGPEHGPPEWPRVPIEEHTTDLKLTLALQAAKVHLEEHSYSGVVPATYSGQQWQQVRTRAR